MVNAMAHVVVTEGLVDREFVEARCEDFAEWEAFIAGEEHSPEAVETITGVPAGRSSLAASSGVTNRSTAACFTVGCRY